MKEPKFKKLTTFLKIILPNNIGGICLAPFGIYLKDHLLENKKTLNHEKIHWIQQMEMLIIFFYLWYIIEWFIKIFKYANSSYYEISFEREAYSNDNNYNYLENRKPFAWLKYIIIK